MTNKKEEVDAGAILDVVGKASAIFQKALTPEELALMQQPGKQDELPATYAAEEGPLAESDFELAAAADALGTLAGQIQSVIDRRMEKLYEDALEVYYTAEELARDPEHADVIPHVEAMRRAHENSYGRPIPPRKEK
jgi:hypothetical protein